MVDTNSRCGAYMTCLRESSNALETVGTQLRADIGGVQRHKSEHIGRNRRARVLVFECQQRRSGVFVKELGGSADVDGR